MTKEAAPKQIQPILAIKGYVSARGDNLAAALRGTGLDLQRFLTLAFNQTLTNQALLECTPASWFDALQKAGAHGLYPDGIHAALVPYSGTMKVRVGTGAIEKRSVKMVQFQPMYQGLVQRAYATKMVSRVWAEVVYQGETFEEISGSDPKIIHEKRADRGSKSDGLVAVYACARVNGETHFLVLYPDEVARHRAASKTADQPSSPWNTHEPEMWKKTAMIALSKTLPHFNAAGQRFAEMVSEAERADLGAIDVEALVVDESGGAPVTTDDLKAAVGAVGASACSHPGIAEAVRKGALRVDEPPPTCAECNTRPTEGELRAMAQPKAPQKGVA